MAKFDLLKIQEYHFPAIRKWCLLQNFEEKLDKIQKVINIWNMRGLSLFGRVTIVKTFLIPKFLYVYLR